MLWQDQGHLPCLPGLMARFVADFLHGKKTKKNKAYGSDWAGLYTYHVPFVVAYRLGACK